MSTVAVVLCNYNHARYLPGLAWPYLQPDEARRPDLVIDDGSTDDSWDIIQRFARDHSNLQAHANGRNLGLEASIAKALQLVRCDYLVWAGADDRLLPTFLERNMTILAGYPEAALSFSEVVVLKGDSEEIDRFATNPAASRIFDLSELPVYLSPDQLRKRMRRPICRLLPTLRSSVPTPSARSADFRRSCDGLPIPSPAPRWRCATAPACSPSR